MTCEAYQRHIIFSYLQLRLSEGFNFANFSSGVINMVREFPMKLNVSDKYALSVSFHFLFHTGAIIVYK